MQKPTRCAWVGDDPEYLRYHDCEWGIPCFDERKLFELLILEGAQAGLSWLTILHKRDNYRRLFDNFDAQRIADYDQQKIKSLLQDPGIVRNRLKIESTINNARAFLEIRSREGSFSDFIWQFVDGKPLQNHWKSLIEVPVSTAQSNRMSRELKQRGFKFVGTTICYAYMQAVGMVNDHTLDCFRHQPIEALSEQGHHDD
ncbi:MAG: DNA-3-methyladenine glycosylase I [Gammaproteobacteria bacterium]|nr:DNA-3-methyladenine glycosylase I [Gammaproteobacteria bacterium]